MAIGLPKLKVYEGLFKDISFVMEKLEIGYVLVDEEGKSKAKGL